MDVSYFTSKARKEFVNDTAWVDVIFSYLYVKEYSNYVNYDLLNIYF